MTTPNSTEKPGPPPAEWWAAAITGALRDRDITPAGEQVSWTRAQLRDRIQHAAPPIDAPAGQAAYPQTRPADRTPLADKEAEP